MASKYPDSDSEMDWETQSESSESKDDSIVEGKLNFERSYK